MKKMLTLFICLLTIQLSAKASNDRPIDFNQLPTQSQQLIKKHFNKNSIALVKMESDFLDKSYEVIFTNGDKIEFDRKGNWDKIDCKYTRLPEEVVPSKIKEYVSKNYSGSNIYQIEKENYRHYEIKLTNGLELKFDSNFNLIDIDN